jgi:hypothetical protein
MPWHRVQFNRSEIANGSSERFVGAVFFAFARSVWPPDAATFLEGPSRSGGGLVTYYVSPAGSRLASAVLHRFAAEPCGPPAPERVTPGLFRGRMENAERLLYTER